MKNLIFPTQIFGLVLFGFIAVYTVLMGSIFLYLDIIENNLTNLTKGYLIVALIFSGLFYLLLKKVNSK
jgi:hypothetical protein